MSDAASESSDKAQRDSGKNYGKLAKDVDKKTESAMQKGITNIGKLGSSISTQTSNAAADSERNGKRIKDAWDKSYTTKLDATANTSGAETTMTNFRNRWRGFTVTGSVGLSTQAASNTLSSWKRANSGFTITGSVQLRTPSTGPTRQYKADGGIVTYRHAAGFIANKATVMGQHVVGEAGAEAIIPLTNKRYVAPFAKAVAEFVNEPRGGVVVTGNTFVVRKDSDIAAIGRAINQDAERRRRAKL